LHVFSMRIGIPTISTIKKLYCIDGLTRELFKDDLNNRICTLASCVPNIKNDISLILDQSPIRPTETAYNSNENK